MPVIIYSHDWFNGIDSLFEIFTILVSLAIASVGYKAYRLTREKRHAYFSLAFALISLSFLSKIVAELLVRYELSQEIIQMANIYHIGGGGFLAYMGFTFAGLLALLVLSLRLHDPKIVILLILFLGVFEYFSYTYLFAIFPLISLFMLGIITSSYYKNYSEKQAFAPLLTWLSFFLFTASQLFFILATVDSKWYVVAHLIQLLGFCGLLYILIRVLKK